MDSLPIDIVNYIITYDKRFRIRKNKIVEIIPRDDIRFTLLLDRTLLVNGGVKIKKGEGFTKYIDVVPCKDYFIWRFVVADTMERVNRIYSYDIRYIE